MTDVILREAAPDSLAALAELVDRSVRVRWTPALEALALRAAWRHALLESGRARVRVLRRVEETVRWRRLSYGDPSDCHATHALALVHVEGESRPRWIDASCIVAVVPRQPEERTGPRAADVYGRTGGWRAGRGGPQGSTKTALRLSIEAAGVPWELYRDRRRRGATHEQAMAGEDRRRGRGA